ncbi:MAG TPA: hypothetical protein PLP65_01385 [Bacteroidales bacterium]|nr:hypothetical protein [Bacteroidales bacterium]
MIRFLFLSLALSLLFFSCNVTKRYYIKGQYDRAIVRAVKKIKKQPNKEKEIVYLEKSYNAANQNDQERLKLLKTEGRPENWGEILDLYNSLKYRQSVIQPILPLKLGNRTISFPYIDYDKDIFNAKQNAAEYWYAKGKQLLNSGNRFQAREAYEKFKNVKYYFETYQDIDNLMALSLQKGVSKVAMQFENNTIFKLPADFKDKLFGLEFERLDSKWVRYFPNPDNNDQYHYVIKLNLKSIQILPEKIFVRESVKTKKVQDGTEVLLDNNNNVVKDSLGNPIRVPRMVEVTCKLIETVQQKGSHIEGEVIYFDIDNQKEITHKPLGSDYFFEHSIFVANGDLRALDEETRKKLGQLPVPFPNDMEMISGAVDIFKKVFSDLLYDNKYIIK